MDVELHLKTELVDFRKHFHKSRIHVLYIHVDQHDINPEQLSRPGSNLLSDWLFPSVEIHLDVAFTVTRSCRKFASINTINK